MADVSGQVMFSRNIAEVPGFPNNFLCSACGKQSVLLMGMEKALCLNCVRLIVGLSVLGSPDGKGFTILNMTPFSIDVGRIMSGSEYADMVVAPPGGERFI